MNENFSKEKEELLFLALGGVGEIGMNLSLYGYAGSWVIVDCGVSFGEESAPGVEIVMADPGFIVERRDALAGVVLTHAHEDHIGALPYLWQRLGRPRVYATAFTAALLREKAVEAGIEKELKITCVAPSGTFEVGPFEIELVTVTHSIPEPNSLVLRTPLGAAVHTGDWKLDPEPLIGPTADEEALRRIGREGVLALVCDSTNALKQGETGSEGEVRQALTELVGKYDKRIVIACFASNVARLESIAAAAAAHDRNVALIGRSLWRIDKAARETGYLRDTPEFVSEEEAGFLPRDKALYICTGSQGEPRSALARIAQGDHPHITLEKGDVVVFSSRIIPGNEKAINRLQNLLVRRGILLVTEQDHFVHVSGHPARAELVRMYQMLRPRIALPVHGETRHLIAHAELALECGAEQAIVARNGQMVRLAPGPAEIVGEVPVGKLGVDGKCLRAISSKALRDRQRMTFNGTATATLVLDRKGRLLAPPTVTVRGVLDEDKEETAAGLEEELGRVIAGLPPERRGDDEAVKDTARLAIRRSLNLLYGKKPLTDVHVVRI